MEVSQITVPEYFWSLFVDKVSSIDICVLILVKNVLKRSVKCERHTAKVVQWMAWMASAKYTILRNQPQGFIFMKWTPGLLVGVNQGESGTKMESLKRDLCLAHTNTHTHTHTHFRCDSTQEEESRFPLKKFHLPPFTVSG